MAGERLRQLRANLKHFLVSVVNTNVFNLPEIIISFFFFSNLQILKQVRLGNMTHINMSLTCNTPQWR